MNTPESPSPEEEARLRRLLAEARETEPMPPDVVARLEAALGELSTEPGEAAAAGGAQVVRFHRRRRTVAGIFAAAAVVVVAGVGIGQVVSGGGTDETADSAQVDRDTALLEEDMARAEEPSVADEAAPEEAEAQSLSAGEPEIRMVDSDAPVIRRRHLQRDVLDVRRDLPDDVAAYWSRPESVLLSPSGFECSSADWGHGVLIGVRYARQHAVLAFREPTEQHQVAEVLQCGTADPLRSVTLSAP